MEIRTHLNTQMGDMYQSVLRMGAMVEEAMRKALVALSTRDEALAREVIEGDIRIDELQQEVEDATTKVIATEQPVAADLREMISAIKIVSSLERIGDHARHLAKALSDIPDPLMQKALPGIREMAEHGIAMLHDAVTAFAEHDAAAAKEIAGRDSRLDALHRDHYAFIVDLVRRDPDFVPDGFALLTLNRFLERLGDHVTNMCEWVVFAKSGAHVELND